MFSFRATNQWFNADFWTSHTPSTVYVQKKADRNFQFLSTKLPTNSHHTAPDVKSSILPVELQIVSEPPETEMTKHGVNHLFWVKLTVTTYHIHVGWGYELMVADNETPLSLMCTSTLCAQAWFHKTTIFGCLRTAQLLAISWVPIAPLLLIFPLANCINPQVKRSQIHRSLF